MRRTFAALLAATLAACSATLPAPFTLAAPDATRLVLRGDGFDHVALYRAGRSGGTLDVYIEHDGTPWRSPSEPAADPTPRNPVMLEWMTLDPDSVLYLGRPCYFGQARIPPCEPVWWTHWRYSPRVVASMNVALQRFLGVHPEFMQVRLYGYSGGGVLATLMAPGLAHVAAVVTVAAPLDLAGWVALHDYSPLTGSLDPLQQPPLPATISQRHLAGSADRNVPPELVDRFVRRQDAAEFVLVDGFDHVCCWKDVWVSRALAH